jgi:uncharacterized membrane protein
VACVAATATTAVAVATDERSVIRVVAGVAFALFVPGRSIVSNWPAIEERSHFAMAVLFSLAILTLVSTVTLWMNYWHPLGLTEVECAVVTPALFAAILRRRWMIHTQEVLMREPELSE